MIDFDAVRFSEWRSKEEMFLVMLSVYSHYTFYCMGWE